MATIKRFEDIRGWQSARELTNFAYKMTSEGNFARDFGLRDQIRRAASSVMSNIAEGFDAGSDADFIRFLGYARRSASEVQSQLYTALDQQYISQDIFNTTYQKAEATKKQINALIGYLRKSPKNKRYVKEDTAPYTISLPDNLDPETN